jgi:molecular chaperone Hsp33
MNHNFKEIQKQNRLYRFILDEGNIRGALLEGTGLVKAIQQAHNYGLMETYVLGQAGLAGALMATNLKGEDRMSIHLDCEGPIKGWVMETNAYGHLRGYLKNVPIPIDKPLVSFDLSSFYGQGIISVTRYPEGAKEPYTGQSILYTSHLAKDLAYYFTTSEQNPSAFDLSIYFNSKEEVEGAGGIILQALPGAKDKILEEVTEKLNSLPSLGKTIAAENQLIPLIAQTFKSYGISFLESIRTAFICPCSKESMFQHLNTLPLSDKKDLAENGPFPLKTLCHYCSSEYQFTREDLSQL